MRFVLWGFVAIAVFVGGLLIFHEPLLRAAAQAWVPLVDTASAGNATIGATVGLEAKP